MESEAKKQKVNLVFEKTPLFAELWDACLYHLLYDPKKYVNEIRGLFSRNKITKDSKIIDVSAGTGFPALELIEQGYNVDCMDASEDSIGLFLKKAKMRELSVKCKKLEWLNILRSYKKKTYDFVFCRGNSFVYATGGWNRFKKIDKEDSLKLYEKTLKIFYDLLNKGGVLYLDKFKDNEISSKIKICDVLVGNKKKELVFFRDSNKKKKERNPTIFLRDENGSEEGLPNSSYFLSEDELVLMLKKVWFKRIQKINLESESHFDVWLAYK